MKVDANGDVRAAAGIAGSERPMIRAQGLGRRFGEHWAIRGMTLEVAAGEVLGLLGPNGAGKTTTVRMLTALIGPSEGTAEVDGHDVVRDAEAVRSRIGILTETPGLYERLSASDNLDFYGRLHGLDSATRRTRIEQLLRLFDLWDRRDDPTGTYSKGMKQKLAIARALLHEPTVLFLDEPTAALDPEAARIVRDAIAGLRAGGATIVLATHNLDEADRLCDRIAFVRGGLLRVDTPARLRGDLAGPGIEVRFADDDAARLVPIVRAVPGVTGASARDGMLSMGLVEASTATPGVVRALVEAGAAITEVRPRAASLEDVYFEVMGVRPPRDDADAAAPAARAGRETST